MIVTSAYTLKETETRISYSWVNYMYYNIFFILFEHGLKKTHIHTDVHLHTYTQKHTKTDTITDIHTYTRTHTRVHTHTHAERHYDNPRSFAKMTGYTIYWPICNTRTNQDKVCQLRQCRVSNYNRGVPNNNRSVCFTKTLFLWIIMRLRHCKAEISYLNS